MMNDPTGGPAFPLAASIDQCERYEPGMFLRDWFAGQALSGLLSRDPARTSYAKASLLATWAYEIADAMIVERAKTMGGRMK